MSIADAFQYMTLGNPISRVLINSSSSIMHAIGLRPKKLHMNEMPMESKIQPIDITIRSIIGYNYNFVRIAGLGGASAIFMGAYCKYFLKDMRDPKEHLEAQNFADIANRIHFLHSFALMCMPLAHYPKFTGVLMTAGTILFSGCTYYRALTGERKLQYYATIGGFCLIGAWLSLVV